MSELVLLDVAVVLVVCWVGLAQLEALDLEENEG